MADLAYQRLLGAAELIGAVRVGRLLHRDVEGAGRLARIVEHVIDEAEVLRGVELWDLPAPERDYPAGATVGWLLRYDAASRAARRLNGLDLPDDVEVDRAVA